MEILGIGPLEVIMVLLIAFIVIGPGDAVKTSRTIGRFLRNVVTSQWWLDLRKMARELQKLPYTLMREANLEEAVQELIETESISGSLNRQPSTTIQTNYASWITPNPSIEIPQNNNDSVSDSEIYVKPDDTRTTLPG
jgi:Sec-independent protein translocase protein TatA